MLSACSVMVVVLVGLERGKRSCCGRNPARLSAACADFTAEEEGVETEEEGVEVEGGLVLREEVRDLGRLWSSCFSSSMSSFIKVNISFSFSFSFSFCCVVMVVVVERVGVEAMGDEVGREEVEGVDVAAVVDIDGR